MVGAPVPTGALFQQQRRQIGRAIGPYARRQEGLLVPEPASAFEPRSELGIACRLLRQRVVAFGIVKEHVEDTRARVATAPMIMDDDRR